jgi:Bacterial Ig-like domain
MRWGEPTRLPPLRRGRGLAAAALLTVGLVAAYAILGVLSLTSVAPSFIKGIPSSIGPFGKPETVPAVQQRLRDLATVAATGSPASLALDDTLDLGRVLPGTPPTHVDITNTSAAPLDVGIQVLGTSGVTAYFTKSGGTQSHVAPGKVARISIRANPLNAGPLDSKLRISTPGAKSIVVPLTGAQAPLPPGAVTATAQARGAVHLTWPASPSTGVAGYEVDRRVPGGPWQTLDASAPAGGIVDQTGPDGQTVEYRVSAVTAGVQPALLSLPGAPGSAVPDATAPDPPLGVTPQPYINIANENAVPVRVDLPPTSTQTDVVSVTLTDTAGDTATGTASGGQSPAVVNVDASHLSEGKITSSATVTDEVGNPAKVDGESTFMDITPPDAPTDVHGPPGEVVNGDQAASVPVTVHVANPEAIARLHVQLTAGGQTADASGPAMGFATTLNVDASKLPDGPIDISAWTVDEAGNPSSPADGGSITKDSSAPDNSASIRVAGGDQNPDGYVNAASAGAVTVIVRFPQATDPADSIVVSVGGQRVHVDGGDYRYVVGPFDVSDRPDGQLPLAVTVSDPAGNSSTSTDSAIKDTVAPAAPTSFTVPESSDNAAGFVNSFTQSAAVIQATFPEGTDSSDTLTASVNGVDLGARVGGSIAVAWKADVSGMPDGALDLHGTITDAAGNTTDFTGRAVKETQPPAPPVAAHVIGSCHPDTITAATQNDVTVQVVLPDAPGMSGTVTVTLTDSAGHTASGSAWGGPGIVVVHGIDAGSFVPGNVHLAVSVTDSAGNTSTFDGTTAVLTDD